VIGYELDSTRAEDVVRLVGALGKHRYVAGRLHLVHAFAIDAARPEDLAEDPAFADAAAWAKRVLGSGGVIDLASKDERLYRRATDAELVAVLQAFWGQAGEARARLLAHLASIDASPEPEGASPFDETREEETFPVLVDAGWELLPLAQLDPVRHKGAIDSFDDFEVARFDEESAIPKTVTLHELPILGGVELTQAVDAEGSLRAPFVLWQQGHETYLDYELRGVLRAAKLV
jgi:hypothetical protein